MVQIVQEQSQNRLNNFSMLEQSITWSQCQYTNEERSGTHKCAFVWRSATCLCACCTRRLQTYPSYSKYIQQGFVASQKSMGGQLSAIPTFAFKLLKPFHILLCKVPECSSLLLKGWLFCGSPCLKQAWCYRYTQGCAVLRGRHLQPYSGQQKWGHCALDARREGHVTSAEGSSRSSLSRTGGLSNSDTGLRIRQASDADAAGIAALCSEVSVLFVRDILHTFCVSVLLMICLHCSSFA